MPRITSSLILTGAILISVVVISMHYSRAQFNPTMQTGFSQALVAVNNAEAAGATPNETAPLVAFLNKALEMNQEASSLPANQTDQRNAIISSVNQILMNVTNQALVLTNASAQRTYTSKVITYLSGIVAVAIGTFAYALGVQSYQRYRIKRTFQMRVKAK